MFRTSRRRLALAVAALPVLTAAVAASGPAAADDRADLPSPNYPGLTADRVLPIDPATAVSLRVHLAGQPGLTAAATAVSTPGSLVYRHFLSVAEVKRRFGPSAAQTGNVRSWLTGQGFTVQATDAHYLDVTGTVAQFNSAFRTEAVEYDTDYGKPPYTFTERTPEVRGGFSAPAAVARDIASVTGLDETVLGGSAGAATPKRKPALRRFAARKAGTVTCSSYWGEHRATIPAAYGHTTTDVGICGYTPDQLRKAYGVTGSPYTGRGRTIAILIDDHLTGIEADTNRFFAAHGLKGFAPGQFSEVLSPTLEQTCGADGRTPGQEDETGIDVQAAHMAAPDARIVVVGTDCNELGNFLKNQLVGADRIVDGHLADIVSCSWGLPGFSAADKAPWDVTFQLAALEGIGFDFATGDDGSAEGDGSTYNDADTHFPASDPWVTAVGGTTAAIGADGRMIAEYPWGDSWSDLTADGTGYQQAPPGYFLGGSGGGITAYAQPAYQRGVVPSTLAGGHRVIPDIAADAGGQFLVGMTNDAVTGGVYAEVAYGGGTSASAPIMAGLTADAMQAAGHPLGFANPALYAMHAGPGIKDILPVDPADPPTVLGQSFSDGWYPDELITLGEDGLPGHAGILRAARGYDDVTGIGAPSTRFAGVLGSY